MELSVRNFFKKIGEWIPSTPVVLRVNREDASTLEVRDDRDNKLRIDHGFTDIKCSGRPQTINLTKAEGLKQAVENVTAKLPQNPQVTLAAGIESPLSQLCQFAKNSGMIRTTP